MATLWSGSLFFLSIWVHLQHRKPTRRSFYYSLQIHFFLSSQILVSLPSFFFYSIFYLLHTFVHFFYTFSSLWTDTFVHSPRIPFYLSTSFVNIFTLYYFLSSKPSLSLLPFTVSATPQATLKLPAIFWAHKENSSSTSPSTTDLSWSTSSWASLSFSVLLHYFCFV